MISCLFFAVLFSDGFDFSVMIVGGEYCYHYGLSCIDCRCCDAQCYVPQLAQTAQVCYFVILVID